MDQISGEEKTMRTHEPVTAITCMSAVALLYLFFSGIQVIYLFLGKGSLPEGVSVLLLRAAGILSASVCGCDESGYGAYEPEVF